jgi:hypothetical protein
VWAAGRRQGRCALCLPPAERGSQQLGPDGCRCCRGVAACARIAPHRPAPHRTAPHRTGRARSKDSTTALDCYLELAGKVRSGLSHIDPYFAKLADGMVAWVACWRQLNPAAAPAAGAASAAAAAAAAPAGGGGAQGAGLLAAGAAPAPPAPLLHHHHQAADGNGSSSADARGAQAAAASPPITPVGV